MTFMHGAYWAYFVQICGIVLLNQARVAEGRLRLVSWNCFCLHVNVCVSVCLSIFEAINNQWCDIMWYRPCVIG